MSRSNAGAALGDRLVVYRKRQGRSIWRAAGLSPSTCCHTFRATGISAYLANGGTLENAQAIFDHESPRTTKLYDRTNDEITLDEVERILIQPKLQRTHEIRGSTRLKKSWRPLLSGHFGLRQVTP